MRISKRVDQIHGAVVVLAEGVARAEDMIEVNLAGADARAQIDNLPTRQQRARRAAWIVAISLLLSEILTIGPVHLGVLPELHVMRHLTGHPYGVKAEKSLYHVGDNQAHVLGVRLPWGN